MDMSPKEVYGWKHEKMLKIMSFMILYIENPKDDTRKLLELINEFSKAVVYKINTQISLALLYSNNKRSEREMKETVPFTSTSKRIKYLEINLSKEAKDLYSETYKTLMKEIKDDTNRWRAIPCSWIGRINIVKNDYTTQGNLQIQCNPYQITNGIFHKTKTKNFKFVWKHKRPQIAKANLRKKTVLKESGSMTSHYTTKVQSSKLYGSAHFGSTYTKIGTTQRRLAWPLHKDDTQIREAFHILCPSSPSGHPLLISSKGKAMGQKHNVWHSMLKL